MFLYKGFGQMRNECSNKGKEKKEKGKGKRKRKSKYQKLPWKMMMKKVQKNF